jgi:hypothetical protein
MTAVDAGDVDAVLAIINDGAQKYHGVIPADRWRLVGRSNRRAAVSFKTAWTTATRSRHSASSSARSMSFRALARITQ